MRTAAVLVLALASPACSADTVTSIGASEETEPVAPPEHRGAKGVGTRVTRVIDGDTFEARLGGKIVDIRLIGIDAPETVHPLEPVECFGPEASAFTERRLEGQRVRLEFDVERVDPFGRTLAYAWKGRRLFNEDILRQGYATLATYPPNVEHVERLVDAERKARRDGLGLWGACVLEIDTGRDWRAEDG